DDRRARIPGRPRGARAREQVHALGRRREHRAMSEQRAAGTGDRGGDAAGSRHAPLWRSLILPLAILVTWQAFGMATGNVRTPLPTKVVAAGATLIGSGDILMALVQSLGRVFAGFAIAAAIGIPLGLAMGSFRAVERSVDPLVE